MTESYTLLVDGVACDVADAGIDESLLYVLRERLGLTTPKDGCSTGQCGACTVLVDGMPQCACLMLAATVTDLTITTLDGLAGLASIAELQCAFADGGAVQCGFCTPGLIVQVFDLLRRIEDPSEADVREALVGNLCRCTGYGRILAAVRLAADRRLGRTA